MERSEEEGAEPAAGDDLAQAPSRPTAPPGLGDLTEETTLKILLQLDMASLAAVRGVCRRLSRIAKDPTLYSRVTIVQWTSEREMRNVVHECGKPWDQVGENLFRTDCVQLGTVQMPAGGWEVGKEAGTKFLSLLEWLLECGASLVSLQTPAEMRHDANVLDALPALLAKHSVVLETLACSEGRLPALLNLLRSQPAITHLCLPCLTFPDEADGWLQVDPVAQGLVDEVVRCLTSLRHLTLAEWRRPGVWPKVWPSLVEQLAPQLLSFVVQGGLCLQKDFLPYDTFDEFLVQKLRDAGSELLLRAVGDARLDEHHHLICVSYMAFAVEGFRAEERGRQLLDGGRPWDPWDEAREVIAQPTLDPDAIHHFLWEVDDRLAIREEQEKIEKEQAKAHQDESSKETPDTAQAAQTPRYDMMPLVKTFPAQDEPKRPDLSSLLFSELFSDFALEVEGKTIPVHKNILTVGSTVFAAMLSQADSEEARSGRAVLKDTSVGAVKAMLRFLYTGRAAEWADGAVVPQADEERWGWELCEALALSSRYDVAGLEEAIRHACHNRFSVYSDFARAFTFVGLVMDGTRENIKHRPDSCPDVKNPRLDPTKLTVPDRTV